MRTAVICASKAARRGAWREWGNLAKRSVERVVQPAEHAGMAGLDARRAVREDLFNNPDGNREENVHARHPEQQVALHRLGDQIQHKVGAEVHRGKPALRHDEERHNDGTVQHLRRVEREEEAEAACLGRGRGAHKAAHELK